MEKILYDALNKAMNRGALPQIVDISIEEIASVMLFLEDGSKRKLYIVNATGDEKIEEREGYCSPDPLLQEILEEVEDTELVQTGNLLKFKGKYLLSLEEEKEETLEIFIDDLLPEVKQQVIDFLGDNGNYDVFPMITLYKGDE